MSTGVFQAVVILFHLSPLNDYISFAHSNNFVEAENDYASSTNCIAHVLFHILTLSPCTISLFNFFIATGY